MSLINFSLSFKVIVYLFCENKAQTNKANFEEIIKLLFEKTSETENQKPNILFSYFFSHVDSECMVKEMNKKESKPANLHLVSGAKVCLDFDYHVKEAKRIFDQICPGQEFMPSPPDPEDIILDDNVETKPDEKSV